MAIVIVAELREYMSGISLNATQQRSAQIILDGVQQELEIYLCRPLQLTQVRERRRSNTYGDVVLSVTPVVKVIGYRVLNTTDEYVPSVDSTPLADIDDDVVAVWDAMPESNNIVPGGIAVGRALTWFNVEYIGGYNGTADHALKLAILEVASRTMTVNHDDTLSIKDDIAREPANAASIQKGWRDDELKRFDRLRRRIALT